MTRKTPLKKKIIKPGVKPIAGLLIEDADASKWANYKNFVPVVLLFALTAVYYWPVLSMKGFLWNDFIEQNFPYRLFAAVSLKQGVLPFWNPYVFSGMPFFADVQAAVLYPLNLILTVFASHEWLDPIIVEYQVIFHVVLAGAFMFLLARSWGCGRMAGVLSAATFMFCGFFTAHIFHVNLIETAAWFPLIIWLFDRTMKKSSMLYAAGTALVLCVAFLCGYPQLMLHIYYWLTAYFIFVLVMNIKKGTTAKAEIGRGALLAIIVTLGLGMSAIQLVPTQGLAENSVRPKLEFSESCEGSLRPYRFVTLLAPDFFGKPNHSQYWGIAENDFNSGAHYYWETAIYTGIAPLVLAIITMFFARTPLAIFLGIMGALSLLLAMGDSFFMYGIFYHLLPGFKSFRVPGRFAFMFSLSISLLAGSGLQWLQTGGLVAIIEKRRRLLFRILIGVSILFVLWGVAAASGAIKGGILDFLMRSPRFSAQASGLSRLVDEQLFPQALKSVWIAVAFAVAACGTLFLRFQNKLSGRQTGIILVCLTLADLLVFGYGFAAGDTDPRLLYAKNQTIEELQAQQSREFFRTNSRDSHPGTEDLGGPNMVFLKNQGSVHRLFLMEGYNPLRLKRELVDRNEKTLDILNVKYSINVDEKSRTMGLFLRPKYFPRCRLVHDYVVEQSEDAILPRFHSPLFDHQKTLVLEEKPALDFSAADTLAQAADSCRITSYSLNKIEMDVTAGSGGLLALSEIYYPEWKAVVDGKDAPLYRADYALRAIPISKGQHRVICYYDAQAYRKGLHISLGALGLTLCLGGVGLVRRRKNK